MIRSVQSINRQCWSNERHLSQCPSCFDSIDCQSSRFSHKARHLDGFAVLHLSDQRSQSHFEFPFAIHQVLLAFRSDKLLMT